MKTLEQLKNDYAVSVDYLNWNELKMFEPWDKIDYHENQVMILVQKECLENAWNVFLNNDVSETLENELIKNENNIIK